jgi:plastocyanin
MLKQVCTTVAIACLFGCGGGSTSPVTQNVNNTPPPPGGVAVTNNAFTPANQTAAAGSAVQWAWDSCTGDIYNGQTCVSHNIVFDDGVSSGLQDHGTYSRTFTAAGTYPYHCAIHGTAMSGSVTVN